MHRSVLIDLPHLQYHLHESKNENHDNVDSLDCLVFSYQTINANIFRHLINGLY